MIPLLELVMSGVLAEGRDSQHNEESYEWHPQAA